jgi:hypothetical protein
MNYLSIAEAAEELSINELEVIRKIKSGNLAAWVNFINTVPGRVVSPECAEYRSDINVRGCWKLGMTGEPLSGGALTIIEAAEARLRHGLQMENPKDRFDYIYISQNNKICALLDSEKLDSENSDWLKMDLSDPKNAKRLVSVFAKKLPDDAILAVSFDDVEQLKALETTRRDAPSEAAQPAPLAVDSPRHASTWTVKKPQRYHGYGAPLYRLIAAAHHDGRPRPTARDVVDAWRVNKPAEIFQVLSDGFDYYDAKGDIKAASLETIRKTIQRMTSAR